MNYLSPKKFVKLERDLSKDENERENLRMKTSKLITKIHNLVDTEGTNIMERQVKEIKKSKDDSSRMFNTIKDLNKMKPKTHLLVKEGNQYTAK